MKLITVLFALFGHSCPFRDMEVLYEWNFISFAWPNDTYKQEAVDKGLYVPENTLPLGVSVWSNKLFFTIPRFRTGVPASLAYLDLSNKDKFASLTPYPSWQSHDLENYNSETIISPFRSNVDACNRLWFVDMGYSGALLDVQTVYETPTIKVIDLETDKLIHKYTLKSSDQTSNSFFAAIVIDVDPDYCNNAYAYISDLGSYALVTYSLAQNDSWRFTHNFFHFEPLLGNFFLEGVNFQYDDGIFGIALGSKQRNGERTLYFHPYVSYFEFSVNTAVIKNKTLAENPDYYAFKLEGFKGHDTASLISAFDEPTNTLFMTLPTKYGVACWNVNKKLSPKSFHLAAQNRKTIIFPSDMKIDAKRDVYVLAQKYPIYVFSTLPADRNNVRILKAAVDDLVKYTVCE